MQTGSKPLTEEAAICQNRRTRKILWTTEPPTSAVLKQQGFHVIQFWNIKARVLKSRTGGSSRSSLKNPADSILSLFHKHAKVAIIGVMCGQLEDLQVLYGYLIEPAFQCGCEVLVGADKTLPDITTSQFHDHHWRYPWTIERLVDIAERGQTPRQMAVPLYANRWRRFWQNLWPGADNKLQPPPGTRLDQEQIAAVNAGDGVVQIIAPAGSGKTTVLIERVKELQKRGTPAGRILCMSFNRDAMVEIGQRLVRAGVEGVVVRSFHGMGLAILKSEGKLRAGIGSIDDSVLEQIIAQATTMEPPVADAHEQETSFQAADARNAISGFKLSAMIAPEEALREAAGGNQKERISARIFALYQQELLRRDILDFDDLVFKAVTLLQRNACIRHCWQEKFHRVLVDEYQDIEPSQALLVGILAAPQDSLFCVGDEDQCIYAWRRATVQRIIELDQVYPGLERHALIRNYRCGRRITEVSRKLVEHNKIRFRKPLQAGAEIMGEIVAVSCASRSAGADLVAHLIHDAVAEEVVVLARTSRLLEEVKIASLRQTGSEPPIELATIHAAKGREWDRVILFAVDEGQTPHAQALAEGGLEDERRLFYVALTRAKCRLEIICTQEKESRFLQETGITPYAAEPIAGCLPE